MLYHLFQFIEENYDIPGASLFQYITFRAGLAIILSLIITIIIGKRIIQILHKKQIGETVRTLGLEGEKAKIGTPTMGGIIIICSIVIPTILLCDLSNVYVILILITVIWMGLVGGIDDYIKIFKKNKGGLKGKFKLFGQIALGLIIAITLLMHTDVLVRIPFQEALDNNYQIISTFERENENGEKLIFANVKSTITNMPFFKNNELDYSMFLFFLKDNAQKYVYFFYIPIIVFIITSVSNAANLTDGIDGLAAGVCAIIAIVLAIFAYVSSNSIFADYLQILYIPYSQDLVVFCSAFLGACIGFLWYNSYPAQVFMGDTGSLTLGAVIAVLAIFLRKELLLPIFGAILLIENLSVVIQVTYFKYTKRKYGEGRRVFLMSPIHHHYQKLGMSEPKIVTRFWIVGVLCAILAIITLKIR